ncbi:unnamed protein product [Parnassius apollo]|uniref:(apollo) hypothetical protein n=1 Tax=Parnassius apollo TaxID=110799 RepID=A0A8S3WYI7_PARAO|nr:unnamed protein product [Parnassius apollo]
MLRLINAVTDISYYGKGSNPSVAPTYPARDDISRTQSPRSDQAWECVGRKTHAAGAKARRPADGVCPQPRRYAANKIMKKIEIPQLHFTDMTSEKNAQIGQAREAFQMLYQISQLLCTGLDQETLTICIRLCELGVDPEVLARVIKEIRKMGENATQNKPLSTQP